MSIEKKNSQDMAKTGAIPEFKQLATIFRFKIKDYRMLETGRSSLDRFMLSAFSHGYQVNLTPNNLIKT